jgi:hypothetical protein
MKKISITNVLTPFVYVFLLWISYPISIFLWERVIKKIVCKVFVNWDHCYYEFIADISDIDLILFAIPTFIALVIIWFFVLRYFNRKLKEIWAKIWKYFLK